MLAAALEAGEVSDAAVAESLAQQRGIWRLREDASEAQMREGDAVRNDVSVPVSRVPEFIRAAAAACRARDARDPADPVRAHGRRQHAHEPARAAGDAARRPSCARTPEIYAAVNAVAKELGGSFSAEHGLGQLKAGMLPGWKGEVELDLMRRDQGGDRSGGKAAIPASSWSGTSEAAGPRRVAGEEASVRSDFPQSRRGIASARSRGAQ